VVGSVRHDRDPHLSTLRPRSSDHTGEAERLVVGVGYDDEQRTADVPSRSHDERKAALIARSSPRARRYADAA